MFTKKWIKNAIFSCPELMGFIYNIVQLRVQHEKFLNDLDSVVLD